MKRIITFPGTLFLFAFLFVFTNKADATHAMGVDLSYSCMGGNQYTFRLVFYRDCAGSTLGTTALLNLTSSTCTAVSVTLNQVGTPTEVSPLCPSQLGNSTCSGGSLPGVEQYIYEGTYTFSESCNDWIISYTHCCRNNMITNLVSPGSQNLYVTADLDNTLVPCNSSPQFTSLPVPYICNGQQFCYNHGAFDPDGDSLVYQLVNAMTSAGGNIAYNTPNSATYPITTFSGSVNFDPATGSMCVTPNGLQVSVVSVRVFEFRNGVQIGSTQRDLQIVVQNCSNQQPQMSSGGITAFTGGGVVIDSNSVEVCPGVAVGFDIIFSDPNAGDNITLTTNLGTSIPGATWSTSGSNPATASFSWTPTAADAGFHSFTVTVQDDGCPILGSQVFAFDIRVLDGTYAGPDLNYCPAGGPVTIYAGGGSIFTWNTLSGDPGGLSCTNCQTPQASPNTTSVYEVVSNLSALCKNRDTVVVNLVPDFSLNAGPDQTICKYGTAALNATAGPGTYAPYSFSWTPSASLSNPAVNNPVAAPLSTTTYYLTATSAAGCTITDSLDIVISGVAPLVVIDPIDTLCNGVPANVTTFVSYECDTTSVACSGPTNTGTIGAGTAATSTYSPHYMFTTSAYSIKRQFIFTRAELEAMGFVGGGRINSIALNYQSAASTADDIQISMGCTSMDEWATSPYNYLTGLSVVKTNFSHTPSLGWNTFTFDYPYNWDGQSNIVLEFCTSDTNLGTASNVYYDCLVPTAYRTLYTSLFNINGACTYVSGTRTSCRPNVQFNWCQALPGTLTYSWTPTAGVSNPNILNPVLTPTASTTYTFSVTDGMCAGSDFAVVEVAPSFSLNAGPDTTVCRNVPVLMNPSVGGSYTPYRYNWISPDSTLSCYNCPGPAAVPDSNTTYVLEVTSALGCTRRDTVNISLSGIAPLVDAGPTDTICPVSDLSSLSPRVAYNCGPTTLACSGPVTNGQIGFGTNTTTTYGPHYMFTTSPYSVRRQYIYTRQELEAMGFVGGGRINSIALEYATAGDAANGITISMGCTSQEEWTLSPFYFIENLYVVKNTFNHTPSVGFNTFTLDNPYMWDGQSNLVIEFCTNQQNLGNASSVAYTCTSPTAYRTLYYNLYNADTACSYPTGTRTNCRPNIQFNYCEALPPTLIYSWSPPAGLSATNIPNPDADPNATTTYQLMVDDGSGCIGLDWVTVEVDSNIFVAATATNSTPCVGDNVTLNAGITGSPAPPTLSACGTNGTSLTQPAVTTSVQGGTGTSSTTTYSPFYGTYEDHKVQYLFLASELISAGVPSGTITDLAFNITAQNSSNQFRGLTISMGCTNNSTLSTLTGWEPTTTVWGGSNYNPSLGLNNFNLANTFDWDGSSNIVVEVCFNNNNTIGSDAVDYVFGLTFNGTMRYGSSTTGPGCSLAPSWVYTARPVIQFTVVPPPPNTFTYTWTPSTGLSNPSAANPTLTYGGGTQTYSVLVTGGTCPVEDSVTLTVCAPLPADQLALFGERAGEYADLEWLTHDESGTSRFFVQRSADFGKTWTHIGDVAAGGTTVGETRYPFTDFGPLPGINTYRLMLLNENGQYDYSNSVEVMFEDLDGLMRVYPNPVNSGSTVFVEYQSLEAADLRIYFTDMLGRSITGTTAELNEGFNKLEVSTAHLAKGSYFLTTERKGVTHSVKLVVVE